MSRYCWLPDLPDLRDLAYAAVHAPMYITQPEKVSLRDKAPPVFDQGEEGSCTANALATAHGFLHPDFIGSRQFIYYGERSIEHDIRRDNGAMIRDGVKVLAKKGVPAEADWPYDAAHFAKKPTAAVVKEAALRKVSSYSRLTTGDDFRNCLAEGHPFVIGFTVYESFESQEVAETGIVRLPTKEERVLGGHAVCVIGYDRKGPAGDSYEVRNSWGDAWGDHGNFWMPAAYLESANLADDAWTLRL